MKTKKLKNLLKHQKRKQKESSRKMFKNQDTDGKSKCKSFTHSKPRKLNINQALPEEILIKIFSNLNNDDMWNVMCAYESWSKIFSSSSELLDKFKLEINQNFIKKWLKTKNRTKNYTDSQSWLLNVPVRNLKIDYDISYFKADETFCEVIKTFKNSIRKIEFDKEIDSSDKIGDFLETFPNLTHLDLTIPYDNLDEYSRPEPLNLPNLKTLIFDVEGAYEIIKILNAFKGNESIENFTVKTDHIYHAHVEHFNNYFKSLPNLKNLCMPAEYISIKIPDGRLESYKSTNGLEKANNLLDLLKTQTKSLKFLDLNDFPTYEDAKELIECIFDEMNLEELRIAEKKIIRNYEVQEFDGILEFHTRQIAVGMEIAERLKRIKKLKIIISFFFASDHNIPILNKPTESLKNLEYLSFKFEQFLDRLSPNYFLQLTGFFDNVRAIKKMKLDLVFMDFKDEADSLRSYLLMLTQLEDLTLLISCKTIEIPLECESNDVERYKKRVESEKFKIINNYCQIVKNCCLSLKILKVDDSDLRCAQEFFKDSPLVVKCNSDDDE